MRRVPIFGRSQKKRLVVQFGSLEEEVVVGFSLFFFFFNFSLKDCFDVYSLCFRRS